MKYIITPYTYKQSRKLGVVVRPSTDPKKKIDVFRRVGRSRTMKRVASVGANGMNDYPTFIKKKGITFANRRRRLYKMRHSRDRKVRGSRGWYADKLLWG
jgi:hypothetical protein